jgi:hypothetical protein
MQVSFPPGEWSVILVGDKWPTDSTMSSLGAGMAHWDELEASYRDHENQLLQAISGPLSEATQQGITADDIRESYRKGAEHDRQLADRFGVYKNAFSCVHDSMETLRQELTSLAEEGNQEINDIKNSKEPEGTKATQIVAAIQKYRALANLAAAKYGENVLDAVQSILDAQGSGQSAREFAQTHGIDISNMYRQPDDQNDLTNQVRGMLDKGSSTGTRDPLETTPALNGAMPGGSRPPASSPTGPDPLQTAPASNSGLPVGSPLTPAATTGPDPLKTPPGLNAALPRPNVPASAPRIPTVPSMSSPGVPSAGAPSMPSAGVPSVPGNAATPLSGTPLASPTGSAQGLTPANLMQSFNAGLESGVPVSAAANAVPPPSPTDAPVAQGPPAAPTVPMAGAGTPVHAPVFETPPSVEHPSPPPAPTIMASPAASASPVAPPPAGPLPAYGSDLRPPTAAATTPSAPPSPPPAAPAVPGSAPVQPTAGQTSASQPAVVRQPTAPAAPPSPSGIGTQAVATTAGGAVAGASSAEAAARARLQRLVDFVARQEPGLAWAAGDRADGTTVLVTDLASGWIPPGIDLPAVVTLLEPAHRRGDLESLLGEVTATASYTPIHYVPDEDDEPVPTSPRPRRAPKVEELGWELNQATHYRDGLPRLAHTLAIAAFRGTGVLEKEFDLLQGELAKVREKVLESYPGSVDATLLGNWQLLAAIDALIEGDKTGANYHLAWFQALSRIPAA